MKNVIVLTLMLCLTLGAVAQAAVTDDLLVAHHFDDLVDDSGNGHDAVLGGNAYIANGFLHLNGTGACAHVGEETFGPVNPLVDALGDFTIAVSYASTQPGLGGEEGGGMIISLGPTAGADASADFSLFTNNDGQYIDHWYVDALGSDQSGVGYADGELHLAVITYEAATDTYTFYHLDGTGNAVAHGSGTLDWSDNWIETLDYTICLGTSANENVDLDFGPQGEGAWNYFDGQIDYFAIWDRVLAPSEMPEIPFVAVDPRIARDPDPPIGAKHVNPAAVLSWTTTVTNPTFDVYFGTISPPPSVSTGQSDPNCDPPGDMPLMTTYYWKVDVWDASEKIEGFRWRFTTGGKAYDPTPSDGSVASIDTDLSWTPDTFAASYDVYFGTSPSPPLVSTAQTETSYDPPGDLLNVTNYYWWIDQRDSAGNVIMPGDEWSFTTIQTTTQAIEAGIDWLAAQQNPDGSWVSLVEGQIYSFVSATAFAVIKLADRALELGYDSPFDPDYVHHEAIERGLEYIFRNAHVVGISPQPAGDPDGDGDGLGVHFADSDIISEENYNTGIVMMAIAASRSPNRIVVDPYSAVDGWTYKEVLGDVVDYMAFSQTDEGNGRGGWGYTANGGVHEWGPPELEGSYSDNSNSGFSALGLAYAESEVYEFNCPIPQFVRDELNIWIDYIQVDDPGGPDDGGSIYGESEYWVNTLKTGNLVFEMAFCGDGPGVPRMERALAYIGQHWDDPGTDPGWKGPPPLKQAMYCIMKGLEYRGIDTILVDGIERDWYAELVDALLRDQQADGSWPGDPGASGDSILTTAWALLTLEKATPPVAEIYGQCILAGESFVPVDLDETVTGGTEPYTWTVEGNVDLLVDIDVNNVMNVTYPEGWTGSETLTATCVDVYGLTTVSYPTYAVCAQPVVLDIPDQMHPFEPFDLDEYLDLACGLEPSEVEWSVSGVSGGWSVEIDADNVATVTAPEGTTEPITLTFTATSTVCPCVEPSDSDEATFIINQPPVAVCQDVTVSAGPGCTADASIDNGSYDPDGDPITVTQDPPGPYGLGDTTVTLTVTDDKGTSDTCSATVTVVDTTPPVFTTIPEDMTVERDGNGNLAELNSWLASVVEAEDTCASVTITDDFSVFPYECGKTGSVAVTWTAEDECGNKASTSATLTIEDPTAAVTYDGDMLLSTGGAPTINANLIATLRDNMGNVLDIDGEEVTFTSTADGVGTIVETAVSLDGVAQVVLSLEPAIYMIEVTLGCSDFTSSAILVVYNPEGGFATGGGWFMPVNDGLNTHPDVRSNFGFNAKYKKGNPTGHIEFRYSDGYIDLKSSSIEQLVITGGKIVQFKGWASVNGEEGHWFFVKAIDNGEPGTNNDTFEIKIWSPGVSSEGDPSERAGGVLQGGNIVVHTK